MKSATLIPACFALALSITSVQSEPLARQASWEARFVPSSSGAGRLIQSIEPNSPLDQAGIKPGQVLLQVNGKPIPNTASWHDISDALVSGIPTQLLVQSDQQSHHHEVTFNPIPKENHEGLETRYEQITSDYGIRQRVIITKPKDKQKPMPGLVVLQGLSCSSIEDRPGRNSPFIRLLHEIIRHSGRVVMRIEKPGLGDSEGDCSQTDFDTELNGYETAIKYFLNQPYVDSNDVLVYGNSMGSALAPYMANQFKLSGIISDGTYVRTWFEHMLEIERRILAMKGNDQATISQKMNQVFIPLYYGMLIQKQSYQDVINQYPAIAADNYHSPEHMYGRPVAFYHQLQTFDVAGTWEQVAVPVRIRWGTNDWIMSEADNDMIIEILKVANHQDHELLKQPNLDHWQAIHPNPKSSFDGQPGQWDEQISQVILDWINEL